MKNFHLCGYGGRSAAVGDGMKKKNVSLSKDAKYLTSPPLRLATDGSSSW